MDMKKINIVYKGYRNGPRQSDFIKDGHKSSKCVSQMVTYVRKNYHKKISIQDLVDTLCMSSTHLNQRFK